MEKKLIIDFCKGLGLDTLGFIPCRSFDELREFYSFRKENGLENEFEEKDIEKRINPKIYMEDGKTIISIAFPYFHQEADNKNGFSIYTKGLDYHRVVKGYLNKICDYIKELGGKAEAFVDSNSLPERYIAYLAGVGFVGKNNMIITEKYGSYVFLGEIITDLKIACVDKGDFSYIKEYNNCKECKMCINECPTKAINEYRRNCNICLSYITQKKEISEKEISLLKGNVFGCDFCQMKCPHNTGIENVGLAEFKPLSFMNNDIETFGKMDNKFFKENISQTSCGWRGKNVIKRNAIISLSRAGYDIKGFKGDSPYLNENIEKIIKAHKQ